MTLPLILAGPILRRAETDRVYVWIATSEAISFRGEIYAVSNPRVGNPTIAATPLNRNSEALSYQIGQRLFVQLIAMTPNIPPITIPVERPNARSPDRNEFPVATPVERPDARLHDRTAFPEGVILAYDIIEQGGRERHLRDLISIDTVTLPPFRLPTFVLQAQVGGLASTSLSLLYASCRKPHGEGEDAMIAAEHVLRSNARDPRRRVTALMLGGDQIYADDVADPLIGVITDLAFDLIGRREEIPGVGQAHRLPIHGRQRIIKEQLRFTSGEGHNHLMTFGEFAAMYLLAWNPVMWPARFLDVAQAYYRADARDRGTVPNFISRYNGQVTAIMNAKRGADSARRIFANVPTYMICDDHEITDDWNLNAGWSRDVYGSPAGRRVVAHGLMAFLLFQAWGNEPRNVDPDQRIRPVALYTVAGTDPTVAERAVLDFHRWSFTAPTQPATIFLNTRTRRAPTSRALEFRNDFPVLRSTRTPILMNAAELDATNQQIRTESRPGRPLIFVAPAPVIGVDGIEWVQEAIGFFNAPGADLESWQANPRSYFNFAQLLLGSGANAAVLLSGDVHYGFAVAGRWSQPRRGRSLPVAQFTSSAMKNMATGTMGGIADLLGRLSNRRTEDRYWWEGPGDRITSATDVGVRAALRLALGQPDLVDVAEYSPARGTGPRLPLRDLIVRQNNVGLLQIDGQTVVHQLWTVTRGSARALPPVRWSTANWPV